MTYDLDLCDIFHFRLSTFECFEVTFQFQGHRVKIKVTAAEKPHRASLCFSLGYVLLAPIGVVSAVF